MWRRRLEPPFANSALDEIDPGSGVTPTQFQELAVGRFLDARDFIVTNADLALKPSMKADMCFHEPAQLLGNVAGLLMDGVAEAVARNPQKVALIDPRSRTTYAELQQQVDECALGLLTLGVRRGDVVTAQLPNWNEFVVLTLALERIGAIINPVAPIFRQRELRPMLPLARPVAVVLPASFEAGTIRRCMPSLSPRLRP